MVLPRLRYIYADEISLGVRANPNIGTTGFAGGINSAILRYVGADEVEPTTTASTAAAPLVESSLVVSASPAK